MNRISKVAAPASAFSSYFWSFPLAAPVSAGNPLAWHMHVCTTNNKDTAEETTPAFVETRL
eukprot:1148000-Pelagomonas_calceolata.AAC.5